jgi:hypothetical protein
MRWLIEFVGVAGDCEGNPKTPDNRRASDIQITQLGGKQIDLESVEAKVLSKVWKACSQASGHPNGARQTIRVDLRQLCGSDAAVVDSSVCSSLAKRR